ncbi:MAG: hypothetical protein IJD54_01975, partial [Clostridia bacterium]|nr:hypothetical protein [Clostridia bacterium]
MIRKNKIVFSIILSIAFLLSTLLFLSTILFDTKQAKATSSVEGFYMSDGAEILIAKDGAPSGIRWTANVTTSCLISDGAEFGIIIDKEPIVAVETNTTEQIIKSTATPTYENGVWTYKCGILYDDLVNALENKGITDESEIQTQLNKAYATTLYARGYAKVDGEYFYAQEGDTDRTLKDVARYCLVTNDELVAGNEATFESYAGVDALTVTETAVDVKDTALLYNGSGSVSTVLDEGEYEVFFKAGKIATTTLAEKETVTTNLSALSNVPYGEHYIDYVKGNSVTRVPFIHASHKISSLSDFATFIGSYVSADSTGWYAVLTSDLLNVSNTYGNGIGHGSDKEFKGTFNGLGHKIDSNTFKNDCSYGQFGKVSGTIKNIAYTNCNLGWKTKGLTHGLLKGGVIENVYVQGESSTENYLINFDSSNGIPGTVKNCLFDIAVATGTTTLLKYDGSETVPETSEDVAYNAVKNTYAIKSSGNGSYNLTKVGHGAPYESVEAFYNAEKNNFNADANKGFNSCWDNDFWGLSFNGISIYERTAEVLETKYLSMQSFDSNITKTEVINLKTLLDGVTPEKVIINGVEVDASDTITLNSSDYTLGEEYRLLFGTSDKLVELPFVFVTYAISTRTEFKTFIASYDS